MSKSSIFFYAAKNPFLRAFAKFAFVAYQFRKYINALTLAGDFSDEWKKYVYLNYEKIKQKQEALKKDLPEEDKFLADFMYKANVEMTPLLKYSDKVKFHRSLSYPHYSASDHFESLTATLPYKIRESGVEVSPVNICGHSYRNLFNSFSEKDKSGILKRIEGRTILDGGAFIGDSALFLLEYHPSIVYAFEPHPSTFENLLKIIKANEKSNSIIPVKKGLSNESFECEIFGDGAGASIFKNESKNIKKSTAIKCTTIDQFAEENDIDVGMIKLDIEGAESDAINGAVETIKKCRPILVISVYHSAKDFFEIKPFIESLDMGYKFRLIKLWPNRPMLDVILICY